MHPNFCKFLFVKRFRLSDFIFVMWKYEISTTPVNLYFITKEL